MSPITSETTALAVRPGPAAWANALLSFPAVLIAVLLAAPFFSSSDLWNAHSMLRDSDLWWHLRNAETLFTTHHFITRDLYSFTTYGQPWIDPEWLAEVPYYLAFRALGSTGVFLVMLGAFEIIMAGALTLAYMRSRSLMASFVTMWFAVFLAIVNFGPRTILFGWMCFVAELLILELFRRGKDWSWLLVPVFCLWVNLHGSWMIGCVFFVLYAVAGLIQGSWGSIEAIKWTSAQRNKLILVGCSMFAALFVNPYGWRMVAYPFDMAFHQKLNISVGEEWRSVNFHLTNGKLVFVFLAAALILTLLRRRTWVLQDLLFALLAAYSGFTYVRFLFLAGLVLCPMVAIDLAFWLPDTKRTRNRPIVNACFIAAVWSFAILHLVHQGGVRVTEEETSPIAATRRLSELAGTGRVFNAYALGGYLTWNARNVPDFLDSRTDIFEHHGVLADYMKVISLEDPLAVLDKYHIQFVFFPVNDPVVYFLEHTPGWKVDYADRTAVILERTTPQLALQ